MKPLIDDENCMLFAGALSTKGYSSIQIKINGKWTRRTLHREMYIAEHGEIPKDLVLDHLCRNRSCVNTDHLEPVTNAENLNRGDRPNVYGTHCNKGHLLSEVGYKYVKKNAKSCRECIKGWARTYNRKNRDIINEKNKARYHRNKAL